MKTYSPQLAIAEQIHGEKYRGEGENFYEAMTRLAGGLHDGEEHRNKLKDIFRDQRFLPAGRIQAAIGSARDITAFNCFVSQIIEDSTEGIMDGATNAFKTMRKGGGIGYDFSTLRPRGTIIKSLRSPASGAVSFMDIYDAVCNTVSSAGNRRGAQMGVLRIDHPDIEEFIRSKQNGDKLRNFNISVAVTDEFMKTLIDGNDFYLRWKNNSKQAVNPQALWDEIMRNTWDWAEPGVLFIDQINRMNNLHYCETITTTNPCAEQPLPPYGACLLGSFNLVKYIHREGPSDRVGFFKWYDFKQDIPYVLRAMDNVIDRTTYPLPEQMKEAKDKRRIGLGVTGLANAAEYLGMTYGDNAFLAFEENVLSTLRDVAYTYSVELAIEKGTFPAYKDEYNDSEFIKTLPIDIRNSISKHGIRNSHLLSIAPCGTISLTADNVSSGIEPVYALNVNRVIKTEAGDEIIEVPDYGYAQWGVEGKTSKDVTVDEHLNVLATAQKYVDSAVSKTCNVGSDVSWEDFKNLYIKAWEMGCKGITTFRADGKRFGILNSQDNPVCTIDPETGDKSCD